MKNLALTFDDVIKGAKDQIFIRVFINLDPDYFGKRRAVSRDIVVFCAWDWSQNQNGFGYSYMHYVKRNPLNESHLNFTVQEGSHADFLSALEYRFFPAWENLMRPWIHNRNNVMAFANVLKDYELDLDDNVLSSTELEPEYVFKSLRIPDSYVLQQLAIVYGLLLLQERTQSISMGMLRLDALIDRFNRLRIQSAGDPDQCLY